MMGAELEEGSHEGYGGISAGRSAERYRQGAAITRARRDIAWSVDSGHLLCSYGYAGRDGAKRKPFRYLVPRLRGRLPWYLSLPVSIEGRQYARSLGLVAPWSPYSSKET